VSLTFLQTLTSSMHVFLFAVCCSICSAHAGLHVVCRGLKENGSGKPCSKWGDVLFF
jgi:hypothetical protein